VIGRAATVVAALAWALAAGCLGGCLRGGLGHPQLAYRLGHGNALAAPGSSRGTSSSIVYRDHGGALTRTVLFLPRLLAAPQSPWESSCSSNVTGTVTTCVWWLTQDAADRYEVEAAAWRNNLLTGKSSAESSLEVAHPSLGGDTAGFRLTLDYPLFSEGRVGLKVGAAYSHVTMHDRTTRRLFADGDSVGVEEMTGDTASSQLALPVTVLVALPQSIVASYRFEWNLLRYGGVGSGGGEAYHPQLSRFGLERMILPVARLGLELQIDGMSLRSTTASMELGLAF
jgi:hypothetical protein